VPVGGSSALRPPRARWLAGRLAAAALAGAALAGGVAVVIDDDPPVAAAPPPLAGARLLGSALADPGRTRDCRGRTPAAASPSCTIVQGQLPGRTLVVPQDGVIRRWSVRSARGELSLVVLRPAGQEAHQVARSEDAFVADGRVHTFTTDLPVVQGDLIGLLTVPGSGGVGVRDGVEGATTRRWIPLVRAARLADRGPGTGMDGELLLRVEELPGVDPRSPHQVTGAAAASLPDGRVRVRRRLRFSNGRPVEVRLVELGDRLVFDELLRGRRTARVDVPGFRPGKGRIIELEVYAEAEPQHLGVYIEFNNEESARILHHFYDVFPREFHFVE
jgi:hypothetical protein